MVLTPSVGRMSYVMYRKNSIQQTIKFTSIGFSMGDFVTRSKKIKYLHNDVINYTVLCARAAAHLPHPVLPARNLSHIASDVQIFLHPIFFL